MTVLRPATHYRIVPKRDWGSGKGFWMPGYGTTGSRRYGWCRKGWIVTDGVCNIMPGALWFTSIELACEALNLWLFVEGNTQQFWDYYYGRLKTDRPVWPVASVVNRGGPQHRQRIIGE